MSDRNEESKVLRKIRELEKRLKRVERSSEYALDDQLFVGVAISLLLFFMTVPLRDVSLFLQSLFSFMDEQTALTTSNGIKFVGTFFTLLSTIARYYGAVTDGVTSKNYRGWSITFSIMGWDLFLLILTMNVTFSLGIFIQLPWISIPIGSLVLFFVYLAMTFVEKRILNFYVSKGMILKICKTIVISLYFFSLAASLYISYVITLFLSLIGIYVSGNLYFFLWVVCFLILGISLNYLDAKKSKRKTIQTKKYSSRKD